MPKIILIHNIINPTRTPLFNEMYDFLNEKWYSFKVLFNTQNESNRKWNLDEEIKKQRFSYEILKSKHIHLKVSWDNFYFHFNFDLWKVLDREQPDIIIHAWRSSLSARTSQIWCKKNNKRYVLWNESSKYEQSLKRKLTLPIVRLLVRRSDCFLSFWTRASEYLAILWANKNKICQIYNTVDIDYFVKESERLKPHKEKLKEKYWIKTKNVLLFVWQLIERKWVYEILEWFKSFQEENNDWSLVFVWWWQEKEKMEQIIREQNIQNVFFPWFFQKDKISELYTIADIFTLPSREEVRWLVINEAMCFWLPIITAYQVWASVDLVKEWENWYIMKENTWKEFEKWLKFILSNNLIKNNKSRDFIDLFKIESFIENMDSLL